jgi:hypothetical protein
MMLSVLGPRRFLAAGAFLLLVQQNSAAPLTETQLTAQARCEVLVKLHRAQSTLDEATLLPPGLQ